MNPGCPARSATAYPRRGSTSAWRLTRPLHEHREPPIATWSGHRRARRRARPGRRDLQMGIGAIPRGARPPRQAAARRPHRDVHRRSLDLVEAASSRKRQKRSTAGSVTAFLIGSQRLYDFVDDNPMVEMRGRLRERHVGDPRIRGWSPINCALSRSTYRAGLRRLDRHPLVLRHRRPDGLHARRRSGAEGRAIIALPSTAAGGVSRIVPVLARGRRRRHDAAPTSDGRHRVRRRRALRAASANGPRRSSASPTPTSATSSPARRNACTTSDGGTRAG